MSIVGFVAKYADEALAVAGALTDILDGLALDSKQAASVRSVVDKLENAHTNIIKALPAMRKEATVKISQKDIDAAVKRVIGPMVDEAVAKALAK